MGNLIDCACSNKHVDTNKNLIVPERLDEIDYEAIIKHISKVEYDSYETPICYDIIDSFKNLNPKFKKIKEFSKDQNYKTMKSTSDMLKDVKFYDVYFNPNSNEIKEDHRISKLIDKNDLKVIESYTVNSLFNIETYCKTKDFVNETKEIDTSSINYNAYGNPNIVNTLVGMIRLDESYITSLVVEMDIPRKRYVIKLYKHGRPKYVMIDDLVPIMNNNPSYINTIQRDVWIILVEKALAKVHLSYCNIIRRTISEIITNFTEAPLFIYPHYDHKPREIWDILTIAKTSNHLCFGEFESFSLNIFTPVHFLSYFIVDHFKVNNHKYVVLWIPCNPHTDDISAKLKAKLQQIPKSDLRYNQHFPKNKINEKNTIYLHFDIYYKTFYRTCVLKYHPKYQYLYKKIELNKEGRYNIFRFKLSTRTKIFLTLYHKMKQKEKTMDSKELIVTNLIIMQHKNNHNKNLTTNYDIEYEYVDSIYTTNEKVQLEMEVTSGIYCLLFKINHNKNTNVIISLYSDNMIVIEEDDWSNGISYHSLHSLFISYMNSRIDCDESNEGYSYLQSLNVRKFGYSLIKVENTSKVHLLHIDLTYEHTGMNLISHQRSNALIKDQCLKIKLSPGKKELIVFEWNSPYDDVSLQIDKAIILVPMKFLFKPEEFFLLPKTQISLDINFFEVLYIQGIFIILTNESVNTDYKIKAEFPKLRNLQIENESTNNTIEIVLDKRSAKFIHLRAMGQSDILYKITFDVNKLA